MVEYNLKPIWAALLDVYKQFAKVCDDNNLKYSVAFGSVLGAVRHKGFIPWDDDFDVMMPRPDYEKFLAIADENLPDNLKLVSIYNTKEYHWYFSKVQLVDEKRILQAVEESGQPQPQGIYVDIFPVDGFNPNKFFRFRRALKHFFLYGYWHLVSGAPYNSLKSILGNFAGIVAAPFFPKMKTQREFTVYAVEDCKFPRYEDSDLCGFLADEYRAHFMGSIGFPKKCFEELIKVPFADIMVPIPKDYDTFLRLNYGDYMKLPPEDRRVPTHVHEEVAPWRLGPTGL